LADVFTLLWLTLAGYIGLGVLVSVYLHLWGLTRLDSGVKGAGWFFRVLVTPGLVALWPVLLHRLRDPVAPDPAAPVPPRRLRATHGFVMLLLAVFLPVLVGIALVYRDASGHLIATEQRPSEADLP